MASDDWRAAVDPTNSAHSHVPVVFSFVWFAFQLASALSTEHGPKMPRVCFRRTNILQELIEHAFLSPNIRLAKAQDEAAVFQRTEPSKVHVASEH